MPSSKEKPFGTYPNTDYNFFAAMNDKINWKKTPGEIELTSFVLKEEYSVMRKENEDRFSDLISKISLVGVDVKKAVLENVPDNIFVLEANPININVHQGERRTNLMFLPDQKMKYEPWDFYKLFFEDLPKSIYGEDYHAPKSEDIKNETQASITLKGDARKFFKLGTPSGKEEFEEILNTPENTLWVKMEISTDTGVSYNIVVPNPQGKNDRYLQYSFPSRDVFKDKTMGILLNLHRDFGKLNGEQDAYVKSFAKAVNIIREELRVR